MTLLTSIHSTSHTLPKQKKNTSSSLQASSKNTFYSIFRDTSYFHHTHFISSCRYNYCLLFFQQVETVLSLSLCVSEECSSLATAQPLPGNNKKKPSWCDINEGLLGESYCAFLTGTALAVFRTPAWWEEGLVRSPLRPQVRQQRTD